ncbi:hypothetical protein [Rhodococcus sp. CH91]|uniref:hypothetical protein n=1 Tax=Rhodococcus sp. CH91 TaxID=2910256 RepID=UPI001F4AB902|nr:hypothetical protein [Rhodococcus sp. CH91]
MLVVTLVLAAVGFGLLVIALMTGSVIWAWGCIAVCVVGAVLLLVNALGARTAGEGGSVDTRSAGRGAASEESPVRRAPRRRPGDRNSPDR